jgi:hypothetical protein
MEEEGPLKDVLSAVALSGPLLVSRLKRFFLDGTAMSCYSIPFNVKFFCDHRSIFGFVEVLRNLCDVRTVFADVRVSMGLARLL